MNKGVALEVAGFFADEATFEGAGLFPVELIERVALDGGLLEGVSLDGAHNEGLGLDGALEGSLKGLVDVVALAAAAAHLEGGFKGILVDLVDVGALAR